MVTIREEVEELLDATNTWIGSNLGGDALEWLFANLPSLQPHAEHELSPDHEHDLTYHILLLVADYMDKHGIRADVIEAAKDKRKQEIITAGRKTYEAGLGRDQCPFAVGSDEGKWWISGYEKGEADDAQ